MRSPEMGLLVNMWLLSRPQKPIIKSKLIILLGRKIQAFHLNLTWIFMHIYDSFLKSLSAKDRARHELALDRYEEIQRSTATNKVANLSNDERKFMATLGYDDDNKLVSYFMSVARSVTSNDELFESSLYRRLLDGKEPLPFAPPLSFSFPWYDVIEGTGPWDVLVSSINECENLPYLRRYLINPVKPNHCVLINNSLWRVLETISSAHFFVTLPGWINTGFKRTLICETSSEKESLWKLHI